MSNFELIDDYLANRLNEQDRKSFEQQLANDSALKADVDFQKEIINGLKAARVAELKAMLNKVTVATPTVYFSPLRIAAGLIGTAVLATSLYFYYDKNAGFNPNQLSSSLVDSIRQTEQTKTEIEQDNTLESNKTQEIEKEADIIEKKTEDLSPKKETKQNKPAIDLMDPSEDVEDSDHAPSKTGVTNSTISISKMEVAVDSSESKFKSHYQFANGKLVLYGDFDNGLYEIIEVNAQKSRALFLYYKTSYYLLDESKKEITQLKEISDPILLQKLKSFRSN
jgi:hypothetical protein